MLTCGVTINLSIYYPKGTGLTLHHIRTNQQCNLEEELEPVEQNLQYDFNYQQYNFLPKIINVQPVRMPDSIRISTAIANLFHYNNMLSASKSKYLPNSHTKHVQIHYYYCNSVFSSNTVLMSHLPNFR